jgi:TPR repeat protein
MGKCRMRWQPGSDVKNYSRSTRHVRSAWPIVFALLVTALTGCVTSGNPIEDWRTTDALKTQAEAGDTESQYLLGMRYTNGRGVFRDDVTAVDWFRRAAASGHADAQFMLGAAYAAGRGVPSDARRAIAWYRKAAEQGQARAQSRLGDVYLHGHEVPADRMWGARWTGMAAEQGHAEAQFQLAALHSQGLGVPRSWFSAVVWLQRAEQAGISEAAAGLATARSKLADADYRAALARADKWSPTPRLRGVANRPTLLYVQHALNRLGFNAGYPDGILGPLTKDAIERYRQSRGQEGKGDLVDTVRALREQTPGLK